MKILVLSDIESKALWDYYDKSRLEGIDLILSGGDLAAEYLSFLATFFHGPVLYVRGNHDDSYDEKPPEGCICIDDRVYCYRGLRIAGLGGSMRYNNGKCQYTQAEMTMRAMRLFPKLMAAGGKGKLDILLTHAPAYGIGDGTSLPHTGFKVFRYIMDTLSPRYHVHGHVHLCYEPLAPRVRTYKATTVVNAYEKYIIELND